MPFYDSYFSKTPTNIGSWLQVQKAKSGLERMVQVSPDLSSILEIGPGWGEFAALAHPNRFYLGLEVNRSHARVLSSEGLPVVVAKAPALPIQSGRFDAAYVSHVLEHMDGMPAARLFLEEMQRVVRPGGFVCINCPDYLSAGSLFWDTDYTHSFPVTRNRLFQMFRDLDLMVVDSTYFAGPWSGPLATPLGWLARYFPEAVAAFEPLFTGRLGAE